MTNLELEGLGFVPAGPVPEHEVTGGFCCDLLSWAMSRCTEGKVWFTVMGTSTQWRWQVLPMRQP